LEVASAAKVSQLELVVLVVLVAWEGHRLVWVDLEAEVVPLMVLRLMSASVPQRLEPVRVASTVGVELAAWVAKEPLAVFEVLVELEP
jgi:hypothetical protein